MHIPIPTSANQPESLEIPECETAVKTYLETNTFQHKKMVNAADAA